MAGLLGVGGGVVMVPLLVSQGFSEHRAHATSLAAIVPIAVVGGAAFALNGDVDYAIALLLAAGSLVGAPLGARVMARMREAPLKIAFGAFMIVVAIALLWP